jgi:hypothetical protein
LAGPIRFRWKIPAWMLLPWPHLQALIIVLARFIVLYVSFPFVATLRMGHCTSGWLPESRRVSIGNHL